MLIRTFEASGGRVELGVGGGITVDSVPVREWQECLHKAEPLARAAGSRLIEGLDDRPALVPRRPAFVRACSRPSSPSTAARSDWPTTSRGWRARSGSCTAGICPPTWSSGSPTWPVRRAALPRSAVRVHVIPSGTGLDVSVTSRTLGPRLETCTLALATRSAVSWRHKWADRTELQAAEELTAPALPYFLDPAGRVAETSRGNLFVQGADGVWRTPPAGDHVLPGVTRRALLDELGDRGVGGRDRARRRHRRLSEARAAVWTSSLSGVVAVSELDGRALAVDDTAVRLDPLARACGHRIGGGWDHRRRRGLIDPVAAATLLCSDQLARFRRLRHGDRRAQQRHPKISWSARMCCQRVGGPFAASSERTRHGR